MYILYSILFLLDLELDLVSSNRVRPESDILTCRLSENADLVTGVMTSLGYILAIART